jgi:flagellar assembly protein FliH
MDAAKKYQFAEAFDGGQKKREEAVLADAQAQWEADANAREAAAFENGKAEALASLEAQTLAQVQQINAQLIALASEREALQETMAKASIELAHLSAVKIADVLIERGPGRLVAETVLHALPLVIGEARIVVRLAEPLVEHIKSRMDDMAMEAGFMGKVVLLGDERIAPGDCRIEWANGGIERRADSIKEDIAKTIRACLSEHNGPGQRDEDAAASIQPSPEAQAAAQATPADPTPNDTPTHDLEMSDQT